MRDVVFERRKEEWEKHLRLEETKLRNICGAIYAAAGSKDGVKAANDIQLFERPKQLIIPTMDQVGNMFRN